MIVALAYAPRPGPLGRARPWVAAAYLTPLAVAAFAFSSPIVLAATGAAALLAGYASAAGASLRQTLRWAWALAAMIVIVNAIVSQRGRTILLRGWDLPVLGQIDVSAEALAEGGVLALRIVVALVVFAVWSACVDPDRVLRAIRPIAGRSALTATLIARLVPLAAADAARLSEAGRLRGPAAAPLGRAAIARRLIAGSLDRSVEIASTLELRGYGLGIRSRLPRHAPEPGEATLLAAGLALALTMLISVIKGLGQFDAYPSVSMDVDAGTVAFALGIPVIALLPFVGGILSRMSDRARSRSIGGRT